MKKILFILLTIILTTESLAQELSIDAPQEVNMGDTFNVNVKLTAQETLGAAFDLKFNKNLIEALSAEEGSFIKQCSERTYSMYPPEINNHEGKIKFRDLCFGKNISGAGTIAVIKFKTLSQGISDLSLDNAKIYGASGVPVKGIEIKNGKVEVKPGEVLESGKGNEINEIKITGTKTVDWQETQDEQIDNLLPVDVFVPSTDNVAGETIEVNVFSAGEPLNNASVTYNRVTEHTGSNGTVKFTAAAGSLNITITKEGYETKIIKITTSEKEITDEVINQVVAAANKTGIEEEQETQEMHTQNQEKNNHAKFFVYGAIISILSVLIIYKFKNG